MTDKPGRPEPPAARPPAGLRLFVALELPPSVTEALEACGRGIRVPGARIVPASNIHLTLKFLGGCDPERIEAVARALSEVASNHYPLAMAVTAFGGFPNTKRLRILWAGVESERMGDLMLLRAEVEAAMVGLGFDPEQRFTPHLTLARVKFPRPLEKPLPTEVPPGLEWTASRMFLVNSVLKPDGPVYQVLREFSLGWYSRPGSSSAP